MKAIDSKIPDISRRWEGYKGRRVEEFIKAQLSSKFAAALFDPADSVMLFFASEQDKENYIALGDRSLILARTALDFSGTLYQIGVVNDAGAGTIYFTTEDEQAMLSLSFISQTKSISDTVWSDYIEDHIVSIEVDKGAAGDFTEIVTEKLVVSGKKLSVDIRRYLSSGNNRVRVRVSGTQSDTQTSRIYNIYLTSMYLRPSNFNYSAQFIEGRPFSIGGMNIGGALDKHLMIRVTGPSGYDRLYDIPIGTQTYVTNAYSFTDMEFPDTGSGVYNADIWVSAETLDSAHISFDFICIAAADVATARFIAINNIADAAGNYSDCHLFDFSVYDRFLATAAVAFRATVGDETIYDSALADAPTGTANSFILPLEIESEASRLSLTVSVMFPDAPDDIQATLNFKIDNTAGFAPAQNAVFSINPAARSNADAARESIINTADGSQVSALWSDMTWTDLADGWTSDRTGRKCLLIPAGSSCLIDYAPLRSINAARGKSIEIAARISDIADFAESVIRIQNSDAADFRGLRISPESVILHSAKLTTEDLKQGYDLRPDEFFHIMVVIAPNYKSNYGNIAFIYVNGVKKCTFDFASDDVWEIPAKLSLGAQFSDLSLYRFRVYDSALGDADVMRNFINSLNTREEKEAISASIHSVIDDNFNIDYDRVVAAGFNTMVVELPDGQLPGYGKSKQYKALGNLEVHLRDQGWAFRLDNINVEGQGTTSMNYWIWNLRFRLDKSPDASVSYPGIATPPDTGDAICFDGPDRHPLVQRITAKKNYASSMQSHKMGATAAFSDLLRAVCGSNETDSLTAVYQYPCLGFQKIPIEGSKDLYTYRFIGLYTIGPDKGDKNTFGYSDTRIKDSLIHLEGTDHSVKGVGFDYPWNKLEYDSEKESICIADGGAAAFEVGAGAALLQSEFAPAYRAVYDNSTMILGVPESLDEINADVNAWMSRRTPEGHPYQRYEFWSDGTYDLYYFDVVQNRYANVGTNLLTQLNISADSLADMSVHQKNELFIAKRIERFRTIAANYFDIDDNLFFIAFSLIIGASDNFKKNMYPYKMTPLADGGRWRMRQDDLDTIFKTDNQGLFSKPADVLLFDFSDKAAASYVFKGEDSRLIRLMVQAFQSEFMAMGRRILSQMVTIGAGANTRESLSNFFERYFFSRAANYFPKSAYNADAQFSYEDAFPNYNKGYQVDVSPLAQSKGDALELERQWCDMRMLFMASYFRFGPFAAGGYNDSGWGVVSFRTQEAQDLTLTPAVPMFPALAVGQSSMVAATDKVPAGTPVTLSGAGGTNTNVYIIAADWLHSLGDLSTLVIDATELSVAGARLRDIKIGDADPDNIRSRAAALRVGSCPCVTLIDARNAATLSGTVDLSGCPRLRTAMFSGSGVRGIVLQRGSKIRTIHLPATIQSLSLVDLPMLTDLTVDSVESISHLRLEHLPDEAGDMFDILRQVYAAHTPGESLYIRVVGFDTAGTAADVEMLATMADTEEYKGVAPDGSNSLTVPALDGSVTVNGSVYRDDLDRIAEAYGSALRITSTGSPYIRFNDPVMNKAMADIYGDGTGLSEEKALKMTSLENISASRYPGIKSFDDSDKLPNLEEIGDSCFAGHKALVSADFPTVRIVGRNAFTNCSLLQRISLPVAVSVLDSAFAQCKELLSVDLPESTDLGHSAFSGCRNLHSVNLPNVMSVGYSAFENCSQLESLELPNATDIGYNAFSNCKKLRSASLPNTTSVGNSAFSYCEELESVDIPNLSSVDESVFSSCTNLKSVGIMNATSVGEKAFFRCSSMESVEIPNVKSLGNYAFGECAALTEVVAPKVESLGEYTFDTCHMLESVCFPEVESLGNNAFGHCRGLKTISLPKLVSITQWSFSGCYSMSYLDLPMVKEIPGGTFDGFKNLVNLNLPNLEMVTTGAFMGCQGNTEDGYIDMIEFQKVKTLEIQAFSSTRIRILRLRDIEVMAVNCLFMTYLKKLVIDNITPPTSGDPENPEINLGTMEATKIYVPDAAVDTYKSDPNWAAYVDYIFPFSEVTED